MSKNNAKGNVNLSKHEKVLLLLEFFDKFGRWPKDKEEYKGEKIGAFAHSIKTFGTKVSEETYAILKEKNFFNNIREQKKHEKVLILLEFFDKFHRWPKFKEEYKNEKIGTFAYRIKTLSIKISKQDYDTLEKKRFFYNAMDEKRHEKVLLLLEFFDKFGRWPKRKEEYKNEKIGAFAHCIKNFSTEISAEDYDTLEKKRFFYNTVDEQKHKKVLLLLEFFDKFGRWPKSKEEFKGEKIGTFANSIKTFNTKLTKEDYDTLKKKEFFKNIREQKKHEKFLLLLEFFDKFGRWPKSKEEFKGEKIGTFVYSIKTLKTKLTAEEYSVLTNKGFYK